VSDYMKTKSAEGKLSCFTESYLFSLCAGNIYRLQLSLFLYVVYMMCGHFGHIIIHIRHFDVRLMCTS